MILSPQYVAGFFDGEGCVNITVRGHARQVSLRVMIVNTDLNILQALQLQYGGALSSAQKKANWKTFRELLLRGQKAIDFLRDIEPFVILKRPQVNLALEFWDFQKLPRDERCVRIVGAHTYGGTRIIRKPETVERELDFKARMHALNRKGVA